MIALATAKARRKAKAKAARPAGAAAGKARKVPETTVVHVDKQVYALLRKERTAEDRGLNAPLRRLLHLGEAGRKRRAKAAQAPAEAPAPELAQV